MDEGPDAPNQGDIERLAGLFAKKLLNDGEAVEATRAAIYNVAEVVNYTLRDECQLVGADVVPFLWALKRALDDAAYQGEKPLPYDDRSAGKIIFGHGPR